MGYSGFPEIGDGAKGFVVTVGDFDCETIGADFGGGAGSGCTVFWVETGVMPFASSPETSSNLSGGLPSGLCSGRCVCLAGVTAMVFIGTFP